MGLAASQARYLALTARKSDLEYQSQTINTRRIQLAYKTAEVAKAYSEGMNNQKIMYSVPTRTENGKTVDTWKELTFQGILDEGCCLIGINGSGLEPQPYNVSQIEAATTYKIKSSGGEVSGLTISSDEYEDLNVSLKKFFTQQPITTEQDDGTQKVTGYKYALKQSLSSEDFEELRSIDTAGDYTKYYTADFKESTTINHDQKAYQNSKNAMDIQSLLVSGKAQIVSKGFFDFLVTKFAYTYQNGISPQLYQEALDMWESQTEGINPGGEQSVIDWRADETSTFKQRNYTEDDADVLAQYEAATAEIQAQDKVLEIEEKNIETQHKAIETEMESVKKVIQKNMDETFKIFS